jgi:hypothetical protein
MNLEKQKLLIEYLLSDKDVFTITNTIINYKYFDPELKQTVKFIQKFYEQYRSLPDYDILYAECNFKGKLHELSKDKMEYCIYEIEAFCVRKACEFAVLESAELLETDNYGKMVEVIKNAAAVKINRTVGVDFFDDAAFILNNVISTQIVSTGWQTLDMLLTQGKGLARGEFALFTGGSGAGKSLVLANLCVNSMELGLNCLYISLELPESMIHNRITNMITGIAASDLAARTDEVLTRLKNKKTVMGNLTIHYMDVGTNALQIESFLREYELKYNYAPDIIAVDYLDLMGANDAKITSDNIFQKDKAAAEQLRSIAIRYNAIVYTASQLNRQSVGNEDHNHSHISGGISKIQTSDVVVSITTTDILRAQGQFSFKLLKTRSSDGVGKALFLKWVPQSLRIIDAEADAGINQQLLTNMDALVMKSKRKSQLLEQFSDLK